MFSLLKVNASARERSPTSRKQEFRGQRWDGISDQNAANDIKVCFKKPNRSKDNGTPHLLCRTSSIQNGFYISILYPILQSFSQNAFYILVLMYFCRIEMQNAFYTFILQKYNKMQNQTIERILQKLLQNWVQNVFQIELMLQLILQADEPPQ